MDKKGSIFDAFGYAFSGVAHAIRENVNIRIHFIVGALAIFLGYFLRLERFEMIIVFVMTVVVISTEMINTSIEEMTDLITTEHRQEAKIAKDVAAGMVLINSVGAGIVGAYIFLPHILELLKI